MANHTGNARLLELPALAGLIASTAAIEYEPGEAVYKFGAPCTTFPLVVSGNARVYTSSDSGRRVTLYRLKPGEVCPISLSTLLQHNTYPATAIAETALQVRYLEGEKFITAITQTPELFSVFLDTFSGCLYNSVCTARQLMFDPLDVRLAHLLYEQFADSPDRAINLTHEDIANELGTTRVVASRMLKKLEHANCIHLRRKKIALNDANALKKLANNARQSSGRA